MTESKLPLPPQGEFDDEGRRVHPYVRDPHPDASVFGYTAAGGDWSREDRSRESRISYHALEGLIGHLSPLAMAYAVQGLVQRLLPAMEEAAAEVGVEPPEDPRGEIAPFFDLHQDDLRVIWEAVERITARCPRCGRWHGPADEHDDSEPDVDTPYVHTKSGDVVVLRRLEPRKVYVAVQVTPERTISRVYERDYFEANFVEADKVAVIGESGVVPPKVGRNDPCPCGSGKKFKRCCGA